MLAVLRDQPAPGSGLADRPGERCPPRALSQVLLLAYWASRETSVEWEPVWLEVSVNRREWPRAQGRLAEAEHSAGWEQRNPPRSLWVAPWR